MGIKAITFGNVIIASSGAANDPTTLSHEDVHVAQYENQGLLLYPDYLSQSLFDKLLAGDAYGLIEQELEADRLKGTKKPECGCP